MKSRKSLVLLGLITILALSLAACGGTSKDLSGAAGHVLEVDPGNATGNGVITEQGAGNSPSGVITEQGAGSSPSGVITEQGSGDSASGISTDPGDGNAPAGDTGQTGSMPITLGVVVLLVVVGYFLIRNRKTVTR